MWLEDLYRIKLIKNKTDIDYGKNAYLWICEFSEADDEFYSKVTIDYNCVAHFNLPDIYIK